MNLEKACHIKHLSLCDRLFNSSLSTVVGYQKVIFIETHDKRKDFLVCLLL